MVSPARNKVLKPEVTFFVQAVISPSQQHLHAPLHPRLEEAGLRGRFREEIANYAGDFCVLGKAPAAEMLSAGVRIMEALKLPVNMRNTR